MKKEIWVNVTNYENYQVSNLGRVRSIKNKNNILEYIYLKPSNDGKGYSQVVLYANKKTKTYKVHRIVANMFIDNIENKATVNHINGIKSDNKVENLEWSTRSENTKHKYAIGLDNNRGEKHPGCKLTEKIVLEIRERYNNNETDRKKLSLEYGVHKGHIYQIVKRIAWKHI